MRKIPCATTTRSAGSESSASAGPICAGHAAGNVPPSRRARPADAGSGTITRSPVHPITRFPFTRFSNEDPYSPDDRFCRGPDRRGGDLPAFALSPGITDRLARVSLGRARPAHLRPFRKGRGPLQGEGTAHHRPLLGHVLSAMRRGGPGAFEVL